MTVKQPLECLIEHLEGWRSLSGLHRTWVRENGRARYRVQDGLKDIP